MLALGWGPLFLSRRTRLGFHTAWWAPKERVPKMSQKEDLASEVTPLTLATFHLLKQHKVLPRFKATVSTSLWGSARFWKHVGQEILLWSFWENKNCHSITWQHVRPAASQVIPRPTESEPAFNKSLRGFLCIWRSTVLNHKCGTVLSRRGHWLSLESSLWLLCDYRGLK